MKEIINNKLIYNDELFPIAIQYGLPKVLNSAEAGVLFDGRADFNDIFTIIYERYSKGIINITEENGKYKIQKQKDLPENSKKYEQELFDEICKSNKINVNKIRIGVLDYCVEKGWIKDYRSIVGNNINWKLIARYTALKLLSPIIALFFVGIAFIIYALIYVAIKTLIFNESSIHIEWSGGMGFGLLLLLIPIYFTIKITAKRISKSRIILTKEGAKLKSHILGYKKYLKKVYKLNKNDSEKEEIFIQEGSMAHTIALNSNKETQLLKALKKQYINKRERSYALQLFLKTYSIKYKSYYDLKISQVDINKIDNSNKWIIDNIYSERKNLVKENEKGNYYINYKVIFDYIKKNLKDYNQFVDIYRYSIGLIKKELENQGKKVFLKKR